MESESAQQWMQRFDDNFLAANQFINSQGDPATGGPHHCQEPFGRPPDRLGARCLRAHASQAQHLAEVNDLKWLAPQLDHIMAAHFRNTTLRGAHQLFQVSLRQAKPLATQTHHQSGNDRQGQRQAEQKGGALARHAVDHQGAAHRFQIGLHYIQAHSPPGKIRHLVNGAEAGSKHQGLGLAVAAGFGLGAGDKSTLHCLGPNPGRINASAVIGDPHQDLSAILTSLQIDAPCLWLASAQSFSRAFQPMITGVANQMGKRVSQLLQHALVELHLGANDAQMDTLFEGARQVAHHAREAVEEGAGGLHAGEHHRLLQVRGDGADPLHQLPATRVRRGGQSFQGLVAGQHQFTGQVHQAVDDLHRDTQGGSAVALRLGRFSGVVQCGHDLGALVVWWCRGRRAPDNRGSGWRKSGR